MIGGNYQSRSKKLKIGIIKSLVILIFCILILTLIDLSEKRI